MEGLITRSKLVPLIEPSLITGDYLQDAYKTFGILTAQSRGGKPSQHVLLLHPINGPTKGSVQKKRLQSQFRSFKFAGDGHPERAAYAFGDFLQRIDSDDMAKKGYTARSWHDHVARAGLLSRTRLHRACRAVGLWLTPEEYTNDVSHRDQQAYIGASLS